jgi:hypothetical protein
MQPALKTIFLIAAIALCGAVLVIRFVPSLRCGSFDPATAKMNDAAKQWLHFWPGQFDWNGRLADSRWKPVVSTKTPQAESALANTSSVLLSDAQAFEFTGGSAPQDATTARPYLLRTVVAAKYKEIEKFRVDVNARSRNSDIWIASGAIGTCPAAMRRHPIVVWLDSPPGEVFVTFGTAE